MLKTLIYSITLQLEDTVTLGKDLVPKQNDNNNVLNVIHILHDSKIDISNYFKEQ